MHKQQWYKYRMEEKKKKEKNGSGFHPVNRSILDDESRPRFNVSAMFEEHRWYFKPDRKGHFRHISCSLTIQYRSSAHRHAYSRINIRQIIIHAQYSVNSNVFSILFRVKQSIHRHRTIDSLNSYIQFLKKGKLNKIFNIWYKKSQCCVILIKQGIDNVDFHTYIFKFPERIILYFFPYLSFSGFIKKSELYH